MRYLVGLFIPLFCVVDLEISNGLMPAAGELMTLSRLLIIPWCRARSADHWGRFVLARAEAQGVYGAANVSHNERTRNPLKHSTCSHKWWETLKGSILLVCSRLFLLSGGQEVVWRWLLLRKRHSWALSLTASSVVSSSSHVCFNSWAFRTPVLLRLLLDLNTYGCVDSLVVFPLFLKIVADIIAPKFSIIFHLLIRLGSFPVCWRSANVTAIPKGPVQHRLVYVFIG